MSCTLEELQAVEYEILCRFDDFCKKYDIKYTLAYGTLLGAIRHNGFIPWDDDVDVLMSIGEFNRFKKLIRKNPIEGFDFCWVDDKKEFYPFYFAKLRKQGTYMPEPDLKDLKMNHGVWIDIFIYIDKPKTDVGVKIQEAMLSFFCRIGKKYREKMALQHYELKKPILLIYKFVIKCPDWILRYLRKLLFFLISHTGIKDSEVVRIYIDAKYYSVERKNIEPATRHIFIDREFSVPVNYDDALKFNYGLDYMTPVRFDEHADLNQIDLEKTV